MKGKENGNNQIWTKVIMKNDWNLYLSDFAEWNEKRKSEKWGGGKFSNFYIQLQ